MIRFLAALLAAFVAGFGATAAAAQESPDQLVRRVTDELLAIVKVDKELAAGKRERVLELAEAKVLPHFDFARMTRLAVGRNWNKANEQQKAALVKEFRTLLVRTYSSSISAYRNQTLEVKPTHMKPTDEDVTVRTQVIQPGGPPIPIDYAMQKTPSGWKVYDVVVDGVSLVTTYRSSFNDQIQKGGVEGLLKTLEERNRAPEPPQAPAKAGGK